MSGSYTTVSTGCVNRLGSGIVLFTRPFLAGDSHALNANGAYTHVAQTMTTHPLSWCTWTTCLLHRPIGVKQIVFGLN